METAIQTHSDLIEYVLRYGRRPGNDTTEVGPILFEVGNPMLRSVLTRPGMVRSVAYLEALALLAGIDVSDELLVMAPSMSAFADDGKFLGAYGPRAAMQLPRIIERLKKNPVSRQEVLVFASPGDLYSKAKNVPCFSYLRFAVRDNSLNVTVHMRSNDAWRGFAYDVIMIWVLTCVMSVELGYNRSRIYWCADSMHLYDDTEHAHMHYAPNVWARKADWVDLDTFNTQLTTLTYHAYMFHINGLIHTMRTPGLDEYLPWHFMFSAITDRFFDKMNQHVG